jgi:hypothetical protein
MWQMYRPTLGPMYDWQRPRDLVSNEARDVE